MIPASGIKNEGCEEGWCCTVATLIKKSKIFYTVNIRKSVAKSYEEGLPYMRRPLVVYAFATDPF
jgi:hypothetical protein